MQIHFEKLDVENADIQIFSNINDEAFPPTERMRMEEIFAFSSTTNTDVLGIYDDTQPIGYMVLLKNEKCGYLYFFAIDHTLRSKGYGSAALQKLLVAYSDLQIVLDFEVLDENVENNEQRIRRRQFYLRNGFHETGRYTMLRDERFEVVCSGGALEVEAFKELLEILHAHRSEFPNILL